MFFTRCYTTLNNLHCDELDKDCTFLPYIGLIYRIGLLLSICFSSGIQIVIRILKKTEVKLSESLFV